MPSDPPPSAPEPPASSRRDYAVTSPQTPDLSDTSEARWLTCLLCGARMENRKCKLVCDRCGYFQSCAEFD